MKDKYRNRIFYWGKIFIGILLVFTIYTQLSGKLSGQNGFASNIRELPASRWALLILVLLLMPINWYVESMKWREGMSYMALTRYRSFLSILAGATLGIITPARVGEYGGRLLYVEEGGRAQALYSTLVCSIFQNVCNVGIGGIAVWVMMYHYGMLTDVGRSDIIISVGVLLVILIILYRYRSYILPFIRRYVAIGQVRVDLPLSNLIHIGVLSLLRYVIYVAQYVLVIYALGISHSVVMSGVIVSSIYFFQSLLPLPTLLTVLARGEIAILLWSGVSDDTLGILTTTFLLWIVNLIIPSVCGYIVMMQKRKL